ncbi:1-deoxy-D-xylulose-5-phosphate synthase [SAR86 cluster bacterium]|nr:1-deoxy-D-xylulose-5-phosphate synthase [SAR86 cluster bacterium]
MKIHNDLPQIEPSTPLLDSLGDLSLIKNFSTEELVKLSDEIREFLLYSTNISGGHFGAGLGVVELTVALHYVFNTPKDKIVWDVGHQAYPHKILTGRKEKMLSMRQKDGLHPFPSRDESNFDAFGVGHSSTSIGAALGMSVANPENRHISVIGDGAITAGMAYEAMAHAGSIDKDLLVILNDNNMSISNNTGGISNYLAKIWSSRWYIQVRESGKSVLRMIPSAKRFAKKTETSIKGFLSPGALFEELGFQYIGPMDGHNLKDLVRTLKNINNLSGPVFLHLVTKKGKGFIPAEKDPITFHALSNAKPSSTKNTGPKYQEVFGEWLCQKAASGDDDLVAITPAMSEGSGMTDFAERFPDQFYDVAIAEQHSMTFAAGLACEGKKPVLAIYSTFLQRAYDQLIHDVAIQKLDVLLAIDRAGFVGEDGATHAGMFDLTYLRCVPNLIIMAPSNENECWQMLDFGYSYKGPVAIRYPRGNAPGENINKAGKEIILGKANILKRKDSSEIAILSFGSLFNIAEEVATELDTSLIDMRFVKPLDEELLKELSKTHKLFVTVEENVVAGGAGSGVNEFVNANYLNTSVLNFGISDEFPVVGSPADQKEASKLTKKELLAKINKKLESL